MASRNPILVFRFWLSHNNWRQFSYFDLPILFLYLTTTGDLHQSEAGKNSEAAFRVDLPCNTREVGWTSPEEDICWSLWKTLGFGMKRPFFYKVISFTSPPPFSSKRKKCHRANRSYCSMKSFIRKSLWLACLGAKQGKAIYFVFLCDDDSDFASIMDCKMRRKQTWIKQMFYHLPSQLLALVQKSYYGEILGPNI